jgi:hypothetical protein
MDAGNFATRGLDLSGSAALRERINVQTRVCAVELRTNRGVLVHIDITELGLDLVVFVEISAHVEMLRKYADLGISARHRKIPGLFTAFRIGG